LWTEKVASVFIVPHLVGHLNFLGKWAPLFLSTASQLQLVVS
jgi:hypothetical protein